MTGAYSPSNSPSVARLLSGRGPHGGGRPLAAGARGAGGSGDEGGGDPEARVGPRWVRQRSARAGDASVGDGGGDRAVGADRGRDRAVVRRSAGDADRRHL